MELGAQVPLTGQLGDPGELRDFAATAEAAGIASLWLGDHVVLPHRHPRSTYPYQWRFAEADAQDLFPNKAFLEALTAAAFLGGATRRLKLGIGVLILPMRNPVITAKEAATIDFLTGGRLILGLGTGWLREEFEALGADFDNRGRALDEGIAALRALWSGERTSFSGSRIHFEDVYCLPRPANLPLWFGGHTPRALARCARFGDGWQAIELSPDDFRSTSQRLAEEVETAGRDPRTVVRCVAVRLPLSGPDLSTALRLVDAYERAGCDHLVVYATPTRSVAENLERLLKLTRALGLGVPTPG